MSKQERQIRIELLRAKANLQRNEIANSVGRIGFNPSNSMLSKAVVIYKRYPHIINSVSAMFYSGNRGKRNLSWRIALAAVAAWQLARGFKKK